MGSVNNDWTTIRISEFGKVVTGGTPSTKHPEFYGGKYPFITPTDIDNTSRYIQTSRFLSNAGYKNQESRLLPAGAVCVVCIGATIGKICMTHVPSFTNQQINSAIVDSSKHDNAFVYYLLSTQAENIKSIAGGAATPIVNKTSFSNIELRVPTLPMQRKIASILSAYDDLIENNNRRIQILEEIAQSIYREWFVHFHFPGYENVRMVDSGTEIGQVPEGWKIFPVGELLSYYIGGGWGKETADEKHTVPAYVIRGTDIPGAKVIITANCPLRIHKHSNFIKRRLQPWDIVFEVSGGSIDQPVGRGLLVGQHLLDMFDLPVICASFCKLIRADLEKIMPVLLYLHFLEIYGNGVIEKYQVQSTGIKNFKFTYFLEEELIIVPPWDIQSKFDNIVNPLFDLIGNLGVANSNLRRTRDLMLPKLIKGDVDVSNLRLSHE